MSREWSNEEPKVMYRSLEGREGTSWLNCPPKIKWVREGGREEKEGRVWR